ncbi:chromosome partitioning protein ParB [Salmonella enterica subsp. enterica serovar Newport]|uniref:plasmid partition protein ParG n=1 Tax=Escherichia coli TaxID=562 RepID=UPI00126C11CA|nr:plasmid partition protein ParG [Escherichia coli]EBB2392679.1 chromosome partitioning protein ParB [Salmonella enterica]ECH8371084.1 chromosome partitioning protein ParB [Salmonella enterica subsp. enterica serovar Agona]EDI5389726.1 chromosome partitioning protein ParB [Salmonella enterica subsp. enterica serovar Newport]EKZ8381502.1 chromosome partitioning protein ParB [Salmonella enterica subsp. enterica serovar Worthington]EDM8647043.1 chromosome partitioning protein ParB [Salmonella en
MSKPSTPLSAGRPSARTNKAATLASLSDDVNMKRVNFELSAERHAKLKIHAAKQGKSIKELLTDYVDSLPD